MPTEERFPASNVESIGERSVWMRACAVEPEQSESLCVEATFARRPPHFGCRDTKSRRCRGGMWSGAGFLWSGVALNPDRLLSSSYSRLHSGPPSVFSFHRFVDRTR